MVHRLGDRVSFYKLNWIALLLTGGFHLLQELNDLGKSVFLDIKVLDVPNTTREIVRSAAGLGIRFITVHGVGENIRKAIEGREQAGRSDDLRILAVTALTSLSEQDTRELYNLPADVSLEDHVMTKTKELVSYGCDGVIASPHEIKRIRDASPDTVLIVAPAIRMPGESTDDHKRAGTPYESIKAGADYLVVGRSIYQDADPSAKVERYIEEIARGLDDKR